MRKISKYDSIKKITYLLKIEYKSKIQITYQKMYFLLIDIRQIYFQHVNYGY